MAILEKFHRKLTNTFIRKTKKNCKVLFLIGIEIEKEHFGN